MDVGLDGAREQVAETSIAAIAAGLGPPTKNGAGRLIIMVAGSALQVQDGCGFRETNGLRLGSHGVKRMIMIIADGRPFLLKQP